MLAMYVKQFKHSELTKPTTIYKFQFDGKNSKEITQLYLKNVQVNDYQLNFRLKL